jgi:hypothetical protein
MVKFHPMSQDCTLVLAKLRSICQVHNRPRLHETNPTEQHHMNSFSEQTDSLVPVQEKMMEKKMRDWNVKGLRIPHCDRGN